MSDAEFVEIIQNAVRRTSVEALEDALGVSAPTIVRWECGQNLPMRGVRQWIARAIERTE